MLASHPLLPVPCSCAAGGKLNTCYNAVDVHVEQGRGDQAALIFDSAVTGEVSHYTYAELQARVAAAAGALRALGVGVGDRVVIYMPMVAEAAVAMLACARLGAIHSVVRACVCAWGGRRRAPCVCGAARPALTPPPPHTQVFGGFASHELAVRIDDAAPKVVVSASCGLEGADRVLEYKPLLDAALDASRHQPDACLMCVEWWWRCQAVGWVWLLGPGLTPAFTRAPCPCGTAACSGRKQRQAWSQGGTWTGTRPWWRPSRRPRWPSTRRTRATSCTPAAPRACPRAWCGTRRGTWWPSSAWRGGARGLVLLVRAG